MNWREKVREIPDFPSPGILFRDILPVLADRDAYQSLLAEMQQAAAAFSPDVVVAPEARGFLLAAPLADRLGIGVLPVRKAGKLPEPVLGEDYALEYGQSRLEVEQQMNLRGRRALVVDDVLATGGTVSATARLIRQLGADSAGFLFLIELTALRGRSQLTGPVKALWSL